MSPAANSSSSSSSSSSRWCPTPEQLMILEEMYRAGVRTPNAAQIQHITAQLSFYGKIEGKNVFYWFQNHKARDRQKLRRKLCKQLQQQQQQLLYHHHHNNYHHFHYHHHQQQQQHHSLLGYLHEAPPPPLPASPALQPLSCHHHNPSHGFLLPQVGVEDALMKCTWKVEIPAAERVEMKKPVMSMDGRDWMMMMDVGPSPPSCSSTRSSATGPHLKTLQLFPITATNLKEECTPTPSK